MCKTTLLQDCHCRVIVPATSTLYRQLESLASHQRMVFFAGLPGTGKSLLIHQLAHLATARSRHVHLLQWDVARPVFEAHPTARPYPVKNGVTHGIIRLAIGLWVRQAVGEWHRNHPGGEHLLIGETPFIGNRFIELAQSQNDTTERLLSNPACVFVIPVPSSEVRRFIEAERERRSDNPVHAREGEDAPPRVLRQLWQQLTHTAPMLGIERSNPSADLDYHPMLYMRVYKALLRHRHSLAMRIDTILATPEMSAYDFVAIEHADLTPTSQDVTAVIHTIECRYSDLASLKQRLEQWYMV